MDTEDLCLVGEKYRWQPWTVTLELGRDWWK